MQLFVFAHRQEAKEFFLHSNFQRYKFSPKSIQQNQRPTSLELFYDDDNFLLVCGEGVYSALSQTLMALSLLSCENSGNKKITSVINLGVCASLGNVPIGQVCLVRTCYRFSSYLEFKSFSSDVSLLFQKEFGREFPAHDIVCVDQRIFDKEQKFFLGNIAPLADRESWSVAMASSLWQLPFYSVKIVSDVADETIKCFDVQSQSGDFSRKLYQAWQNIFSDETLNSNKEFDFRQSDIWQSVCAFFHITIDELHVTHSQFQKLNSLVQTAQLKCPKFSQNNSAQSLLHDGLNSAAERWSANVVTEEREPDKPSPKLINKKTATAILIDIFEEFVNPVMSGTRKKIQPFEKKLNNNGIQLSYDKTLESSQIALTIAAENHAQLQHKLDAVKKFSFEEIFEILSGDIGGQGNDWAALPTHGK